MQNAKTFEVYKKRLAMESGIYRDDNSIRYIVIEYLCQFPGIDPVKMGAALMLDGYKIVFDDSSITATKNAQKRHYVESATGLNPMCFDCST